MGRPKIGYHLDGAPVVGVTTVLRQKDSIGLIQGANAVGRRGKRVYSTKAEIGEWSRSASIGSCAHDRIEAAIRGVEPDLSDYTEEIQALSIPPFESFKRWAVGKTLNGQTEVPLVHRDLRFGGTIDYIDRETNTLYDWKTSGSLDYRDDLYGQVAGGYLLLCEQENIKIDRCIVVRFPKEGTDAEFLTVDVPSTIATQAKSMFLGLLAAYNARLVLNAKGDVPY